MEKLLNDVVKRITPTKTEKELESDIISEIIDILSSLGVNPIVVGSTAKGTDLRGDKDIDIFMRFPADTSREELEKKGLEFGKTTFDKIGASFEIDFSEHPYTKGVYKDYEIELVPCYGEGGIKSSVDRTPLHTEYVINKISDIPNLASEIRLMKRFFKAAEVYGAEEKVRGFSGYLVEVLVIHYGGFIDCVKAIGDWNINQILDPEGLWEDSDALKYYFTNTNLIVIDPVDKDRNMAAAVSSQKLAELIIHCREFLIDKKIEYFFPVEKELRSIDELSELISSRGTHLLAFKFTHEKLNENLLYSQLRKTEKSIKKEYEADGFRVFKSSFYSNEKDMSIILFEFAVFELPPIKHHGGPPVDGPSVHQERFHEKYEKEKPYILDGFWVVDAKREITDVEAFGEFIIKKRDGFGKHLRKTSVELISKESILEIDDINWLKHLDKLV